MIVELADQVRKYTYFIVQDKKLEELDSYNFLINVNLMSHNMGG